MIVYCWGPILATDAAPWHGREGIWNERGQHKVGDQSKYGVQVKARKGYHPDPEKRAHIPPPFGAIMMR